MFVEQDLPAPSNWLEYERKKYGGFHCKAQWTQSQTNELFDYMGKVPDGFEYKWPKEEKA